MRKLVFIYVILLFTLVSCSVNMEPNSNSQDTNPKNSLEQKDNTPVIMETEKYTTEKVEFAISGFKPMYVFGLDDENIAVVMFNKKSPDLRRVYNYNLSHKQSTLLFEGELTDVINLKKVVSGDYLLEGGNVALEIDEQSYKINKIIPYPEGAYEGDSSYDQTQLVYNKEEGLYLHKQNAPSSKDIELYKYDDEKEIRPASPFWSYDDKKIGHILFHRRGLFVEFVILDSLGQKPKSYNVGSNGFVGWWFQDNMRFLTYSNALGKIPVIKVIDTTNDQIKEYEKPGLLTIECSPHGDQVLYVNLLKKKAEERYSSKNIISFNVATNTSEIVTPGFLNLRSSNFSPSGNKILFVGNLIPGEDLSVYITQKKAK